MKQLICFGFGLLLCSLALGQAAYQGGSGDGYASATVALPASRTAVQLASSGRWLPSPAKPGGQLRFQGNGLHPNTPVTLLNLQGQTLATLRPTGASQLTLHLPKLAPGLYLLRYEAEQVQQQKLQILP